MDIKLLDELERLEKAATPGPWQTESPIRDGDGWAAGVVVAAVSRGQCVYSLTTGGSMPEADRQLIAFLRTHAPTLIAAAREGVRLREEVSSWREPTPEAPPEFTKLPLHATGGADCWHGHGVAVTAMYCTRTRGFDRFEVYRGGRPLSPVGDAVNFIGWDAVVKAALTPTPEPTP